MSEPCSLLWLDIETTGLDFRKDFILEVACFVTEPDGSGERYHRNWVIKPENRFWSSVLIANDFVLKMHTDSGLYKEVKEIGLKETEWMMEFEEFLQRAMRDSVGDKFTMAGSGVGPFDRIWFKTNYPQWEKYFNYYVMDVGVLGRFFRHSVGIDLPERPVVNHRAADDIKDHFEEFKQYRGLLNGA